MMDKDWYFDRGSRLTVYLTQSFREWGVGLSFYNYPNVLQLEMPLFFWHITLSFYYGKHGKQLGAQ